MQALRRRSRAAAAGLIALLLATAVVADRLSSDDEQPQRPELQRVLDRLVAEPEETAVGATAFVSGSEGRWSGAAGIADWRNGSAMPPGARMRLESVSKIYTAALIESLAEDGKLRLDDRVERWLPGLLPAGDRITIRHLLTMQSGLVDNNDVVNADGAESSYLAHVRDPALRARLLELAASVEADPAVEIDPIWWIKLAAWQPLLFDPGGGVRYSNIGYDVVGLIAARAGGAPLRQLFRERVFEPLGLDSTAYDPQGPIAGAHARGYAIRPDGTRVDATEWHYGVGADGGIVSDAADTAAFLEALMAGDLLEPSSVRALQASDLWFGGTPSGCGSQLYGWSGGGTGYRTEAWVDADGRVVVLLLNSRHLDTGQPEADATAHAAALELYCAG